MDESLKNRTLKVLEDDQNQLEGAFDKQTDITVPEKIEKVTVTQNSNGRWEKTIVEEDSNLYDENAVGQIEQQIEDDAKTLQEFCAVLDNQIISFNAQINAKKQQIVDLSTEAIGRNCWPGIAYSTTTLNGIIRNTGIGAKTQNMGIARTSYQDRDALSIYENMAGPNQNFSADNPFDPNSIITLTGPYAGFGYENVKENDGGSSIGTARTDISGIAGTHIGPKNVGSYLAYAGVGVSPDATITDLTGTIGDNRCVGISNSITTLLAEIETLRTQRDAAVNRTNLNSVKSIKKEKELQNWGCKNLKERVNARKTKNSSAIAAVNNTL